MPDQKGRPAEIAMEPMTVQVGRQRVSALLSLPPRAEACFVFGHGAGAGMMHRFMTAVAEGLAERRIATLRYQFPYMEDGARRPGSPKLAQATVRAAVAEAERRRPELPLFAGGKSYGGRMTSEAQSEAPLPGVRGLAFFGFPLHPPGKPSGDRAAHLSSVGLPMLFLQGTNDALAEIGLIETVVSGLGTQATLVLLESADHSFHVPARSGRKDAEIMAEALDAMSSWIRGLIAPA